MNIETITSDKIKHLGIKALVRELGPAGMIRFIQQYETGEGDYSEERHKSLENANVKTIAGRIKRRRKR
jgi:hypothetical protein